MRNILRAFAKKQKPTPTLLNDHLASLLDGSGLFDADWYRSTNPDIGNLNPTSHYLDYGGLEGRRPSPHFDGASYLDMYPDVRAEGMNPVVHWVLHGLREGRKFPTPTKLTGEIKEPKTSLLEFCNPKVFENPSCISDSAFKVSILTPTFNTPPVYIWELFNSIRNQTYGNWEWVITDDCSDEPGTISALRQIAAMDHRVKINFEKVGGGISKATNESLNAASGNYVALVDHDDLLSRDILLHIYKEWQNSSNCDVFYTDEAKLSQDGRVYDFYFKPGWSPTLLENTMYIGHLTAYRTDLPRSIGGFRTKFDGTQDYDLALRLSRCVKNVIHIDKIGYLWRAIPGSTAMAISEKSYAVTRQQEALAEFASFKSPEALVTQGSATGYWRIDYPLKAGQNGPLLSFVIPSAAGSRQVRGNPIDLVTNCIQSMIEKEFYRNCEFIVVHNGNLTQAQNRKLNEIKNIKLVLYDEAIFNFSRKINLGVSQASGKYVCLLNDDIEAITQRGGEAMVGFLEAHPAVGAIAPMCLFEDGSVQHNGVVFLEQGPSHYGIFKGPEFGGHFNILHQRREVLAVSGALLIVRKDIYEEVGGFDEKFPLNYNDVHFCLKLAEIGRACVVDPKIKVFHYESSSKSGTFKCEKEMFFRISPAIEDKFFNKNFVQSSPHFVFPDSIGARGVPSFERQLDEGIRLRRIVNKNKNLKCTIGVSIYNQTKGQLNEMFASISNQTYENVEIVIYDDGSTLQETKDWVRSLKMQEGPMLKVLEGEVNGGIMNGQRNLLKNCTGDYFLPVDADDFVTIDCVEIMVAAAYANRKINVFFSNEFKADEHSNKVLPFSKGGFDSLKLMNCCYVTHQMMFKTSFLRDIGAYEEDSAKWCHDWDTSLRALCAGASFHHVPELVYAWRIHSGSTASAEAGAKPEAVSSQEFVLRRTLDALGLTDRLDVEQNRLGPNTGMWALKAKSIIKNVTVVRAEDLWLGRNEGTITTLRDACRKAGKDGWVALLLEQTNEQDALLDFSAVCHFDNRIGLVGSTLLHSEGHVLWSGGALTRDGIIDPSRGSQPVCGGYHGELYCQRQTEVVAAANMIVRGNLLAECLKKFTGEVSPDALVVELALLAKRNKWMVATTPHVQAVLPNALRHVLPVDRDARVLECAIPNLPSMDSFVRSRVEARSL